MSQRGMASIVIVGIVVAVVVVAGISVAAVVVLSGGGGAGGGVSIETARSLQFDFEATTQGQTVTGTMQLKDIGTQNMKMKMEASVMGQSMTVIVNGQTHEAWMYMMGEWMDVSSSFEDYWEQYSAQAEQYRGYLSNWSGSGEYNYTDPSTGVSVRIYNIQVNPSLSDSLFTRG